ncbi:MAG: glycoside hydrolase family 172 protein [Myxococcota bacterium]
MVWSDPSRIDLSLESRSVSFENPTGARAAGGAAHGGRKGAPFRELAAGERVVLADLEGPGTIRHVWLTIPPAPPERMRAVRLEVFYDGLDVPSISVPVVDFFGAPLGRPVPLVTALSAIQEGRGFNAYYPMPFERRVRVELVNESTNRLLLYYQIDYTLDRGADKLDRGAAALDPHSAPEREPSYLHVAYRRENPTTQKRDFVIFEGLRGPGRFLGSVVGIRVRQDELFAWYGEGEVKMFFDGEGPLPTICGTGLEDYVGTAWAMGPHQTPHAGVPFEIRDPARPDRRMPDLTGFYRWHLADPIVFRESLRVTIQQIGAVFVLPGEEAKRAAIDAGHPVAGTGWRRSQGAFPADWAIAERSDDYCAAAFAYCRTPQAVRRYASEEATAQVERLPYEQASPAEAALDFVGAAIGQG